jgi:hypothetical protein
MSEHTPSPRSLEAKHELSDVRSMPLVWSALVLAIAVAAVCLFLNWFFDWLELGAKRHDPTLSPLVGSQVPPEPRLQGKPANDLARMRAAEDRSLDRYRWIDKERGVVQLPIDRAMELLLEQGLPETSAEVPPAEPADEAEKEAGR